MDKRQIRNALRVRLGFVDREREKNRIPRVLFYHGVAETHEPFVEGLHIGPEAFRKQLDYLTEHYEFVSMDEYYDRWKAGTFTGQEVTLTFDDGYRNNLTVAAPILREYGVPFAVFVSTNHMGTDKRFATFIGRAIVTHPAVGRLQIPAIGMDCPLSSSRQRKETFKALSRQLKHSDIQIVETITAQLTGHLSAEDYQTMCNCYAADAPMSWEEVATLQKQYGCTIGSHCIDHFICDSFQEEAEMFRQIANSKTTIEQKLGTPCLYLAYPNGNTCAAAQEAARQAGYRLAFTTANKRLSAQSSPFAMPRYGVNFSLNTFMTDLAYKPKRRF